jgi:probable rRNA maturation factor
MLKKSLEILSITDSLITLLLVGDRRMRALNRTYLGTDRATNVLAFPYEEGNSIEGDRETKSFEGDIVVSVETVLSEVPSHYLNVEEKLFFYAVHGLLHLAGYEHTKGPTHAMKMRNRHRSLFKEVTGKDVD